MGGALRQRTAALAVPTAAIGGAFLVGGAIIQLAGYDAFKALGALMVGAFGSVYGLGETVVRSCPLLLTGLAVSFAFRCGIWNIGAEGQFLMGALMAAWVAPTVSGWGGVFGTASVMAVSLVAGGTWGALAAGLKVWRNVQEVISTIMLNFIAIQLIGFAVHGPLMETAAQFPQTDPVAQTLRLTRGLAPTRIHTGILVGLLTAGLLYVLLFRTAFGYRIRAVGLNPDAAHAAGIDVSRSTIAAMGVSGAIAGLAGAVELTGVTFRLYEDFAGGYGYTAIAVALLGRLHPGGVLLTALLFGALETGASAMQRAAGVSAVLVYVIQALILLFVVTAAVFERFRAQRAGGR